MCIVSSDTDDGPIINVTSTPLDTSSDADNGLTSINSISLDASTSLDVPDATSAIEPESSHNNNVSIDDGPNHLIIAGVVITVVVLLGIVIVFVVVVLFMRARYTLIYI